ncbi:MAG: hypothetical protein MIO93_01035, partial [ANME-2 cluster archaeon]|nr:hypothetical protein [ANME-2 cluster archaeon]
MKIVPDILFKLFIPLTDIDIAEILGFCSAFQAKVHSRFNTTTNIPTPNNPATTPNPGVSFGTE